MSPMQSPLRALGSRLRLVLLLAGASPLPGAAQATGGLTTSLAMATEAAIRAVTAPAYPVAGYAGRDDDGVPRYIQRPFSLEERRLLRERFGIEEPGRLYLSDTSDEAYLNYDTERDPGAGRLVRSYRVGAHSVRVPGESWEELQRRLAGMRPDDFPASARLADTALAALDSEARPAFERMLGAARRWISFRRWVTTYDGGRFRLIGAPEKSWDWPHVELAGPLGYRSIEALLLAAGRVDALNSWHDPARSRATPLTRPGSGGFAVRHHGAAGRPALPPGRERPGRGDAGGSDPSVAGQGDE